jgi:hypothetical protein
VCKELQILEVIDIPTSWRILHEQSSEC